MKSGQATSLNFYWTIFYYFNFLLFGCIFFQLPDKSIALLVKYYYLWKNKKKKTSVIDRHAKKSANNRAVENQNGSREGSSSAESEPDDKV